MTHATASTALPQLLAPESYRPCDWDLLTDHEARPYWLGLFLRQFEDIARSALESGYGSAAIDDARAALTARVRDLESDPSALGPHDEPRLDILALDHLRDGVLRDRGIDDAFRAVKERAGEAALAMLPARLDRLDSMDADERALEIARGVFAGNLFDMGAPETASRFAAEQPRFADLVSEIKPRPWLYDDFAPSLFDGRSHAVLFVDNAGGDVLLGMVPLARELAKRGSRVTIAANEDPALNDVTASELAGWLERAERENPHLGVSPGWVRSTGSDEPLLDLTALDPGFVDAVRDADLLVFEGMGRAVETNWVARFDTESWRLATLKDPAIARKRGGALYDCIWRVEAPGQNRCATDRHPDPA